MARVCTWRRLALTCELDIPVRCGTDRKKTGRNTPGAAMLTRGAGPPRGGLHSCRARRATACRRDKAGTGLCTIAGALTALGMANARSLRRVIATARRAPLVIPSPRVAPFLSSRACASRGRGISASTAPEIPRLRLGMTGCGAARSDRGRCGAD
jgi:hypothetical protein